MDPHILAKVFPQHVHAVEGQDHRPSYLSIEGLSILYFGLKPYDNAIEAYFRNEGRCGWHGELGGAEWKKPEEVPR
jgi:hypothetical protein